MQGRRVFLTEELVALAAEVRRVFLAGVHVHSKTQYGCSLVIAPLAFSCHRSLQNAALNRQIAVVWRQEDSSIVLRQFLKVIWEVMNLSLLDSW